MSIRLTGSTFDTLVQASPLVLTLPFTLGFWVYPMGTGIPWSMGGAASDIGYRIENSVSSTYWSMKYYNGTGNVGQAEIVASGIANAWQHLIVRYISNTNRRMSLVTRATVAHANNTDSITPAALAMMTLGAAKSSAEYAYYTGAVGEFFFADADIMPGGGVMSDSLHRQIAYCGPFSVDHVASKIVEYRSGRTGLGSRDDSIGEIYQRSPSRPWVPANAPKLWEHPPLDPGYVRPDFRQQQQLVLV